MNAPALRLQPPGKTSPALQVLTAQDLLGHPFHERKWLLQGLLKERQMMMLYAPSGVGKSWFAWSMACAIAGGGGFHTYTNEEPRKVLYLDGEMDGEDAQERLRVCTQATNADQGCIAQNLLILSRQMQPYNSDFPDLNSTEWQTKVITYAKEQEVEFIVLDNFSTLAEIEDENSAAAFNGITSFLLRMKQAGISGLLVHHSNKADSGYRGSQKLSVTFDLIVALKRPETSEGSGCAFDVVIDKARSQVEVAPVQLILKDFGWSEGESDAAMARLIRFLKTGRYATQGEVGQAAGISKGHTSKLFNSAIKAGMITKEELQGYLARARMADVTDCDLVVAAQVEDY